MPDDEARPPGTSEESEEISEVPLEQLFLAGHRLVAVAMSEETGWVPEAEYPESMSPWEACIMLEKAAETQREYCEALVEAQEI